MRAPTPPRMRVLFLSRLFSGLKSGLADGRWEPRGVPTIYHLLEGLARDPAIELMTVFTDKEADARFPRIVRHDIAPIGDTLILPWRRLPGRLPHLELALTEAEQAVRILAVARLYKPDVVYATYANIHVASLLARAGYKVVLRLMGIVPHHREIAEGRFPLFRWELRSPFAAVVSSEDGSDAAAIMPRMLRPDVPQRVRLNGCDAAPLDQTEIQAFRTELGLGERPVVCFLGRLEPQKGALPFIEAALALLAQSRECADVLVVGDGPLRAEMQARATAAGQSSRIRFLGALPHARAYRCVGASDIYVSVNLFGNLSNANLEALTAGACLVIPTSDPAIPLDTMTDRLIPCNAAVRYDRNGLPHSIAQALAALLGQPGEIARRREASPALAARLIRPWSVVIAEDIAHIKSLAVSHAMGTAAGAH